MKKTTTRRTAGEPVVEYDLSGGVRGKYAEQYKLGTNVVLLEPELSKAFPDSESVNQALRDLLSIAKRAGARQRK